MKLNQITNMRKTLPSVDIKGKIGLCGIKIRICLNGILAE